MNSTRAMQPYTPSLYHQKQRFLKNAHRPKYRGSQDGFRGLATPFAKPSGGDYVNNIAQIVLGDEDLLGLACVGNTEHREIGQPAQVWNASIGYASLRQIKLFQIGERFQMIQAPTQKSPFKWKSHAKGLKVGRLCHKKISSQLTA